jgi:hypothetical protein
VRLSDFDRTLLAKLDGTRDEHALVSEMMVAAASDDYRAVEDTVRSALEQYRLCALLVA